MPLDPFFSLSPLNPHAHTYDAVTPGNPWTNAYFISFGGHTGYHAPLRLADQYDNDEIVLAEDAVFSINQSIDNFQDDLWRRCIARINFNSTNVSTDNQYLMVFRLAHAFGSPIAQFFVGTQFVRAEVLTGSPYDDIAILVDTPGDGVWVYITVRLAADAGTLYHGFTFMGVDCYLL